MDTEKLTSLIVSGLNSEEIADALGLRPEAIQAIAENHKEEIANKMLERMSKPVENNNDMQDLLSETLKTLRQRIKLADIKDLVDTIKVLTNVSGKDIDEGNYHQTYVINNIFDGIEKPVARVSGNGEIMAIENRAMIPMSVNNLRGIFDERQRKSTEGARSLEKIA